MIKNSFESLYSFRIILVCLCSLVLLSSCSKIEAPTGADTIITSNKIVVWGHSAGVIIEPFIKYYFEEALDKEILFEPCSVNGETMLAVAARQGSLPAFFSSFDCSKVDNGYVIATEDHPLRTLYDNSTISFSIVNGFNPCSINGIPGNLSIVGNKYIFKPNFGQHLRLRSTNLIIPYASAEFKNALVSIFWCDQGIDKVNLSTFFEKYEIMTHFVGNSNFFILGSVTGDDELRGPLEEALKERYGIHYFNGRKYLLSEATKEINRTTSRFDIECIEKGQLPSFYMKDDIHLNDRAAKILSKKVVEVIVDYLQEQNNSYL